MEEHATGAFPLLLQVVIRGSIVNEYITRATAFEKLIDRPTSNDFGTILIIAISFFRGSDGCLTLKPSDWSSFIQLFLNAFPNIDDWHTLGNNTGKKIGSLVIKQS